LTLFVLLFDDFSDDSGLLDVVDIQDGFIADPNGGALLADDFNGDHELPETQLLLLTGNVFHDHALAHLPMVFVVDVEASELARGGLLDVHPLHVDRLHFDFVEAAGLEGTQVQEVVQVD